MPRLQSKKCARRKKRVDKKLRSTRTDRIFSEMPYSVTVLKNAIKCRFNNWKNKFVSCPMCSESMTLGEYVSDHARSEHRLDENEICIFCRDFVVRDPKSYDEIAHRNACSKQFIERVKQQKRKAVDEIKRQAVYSRRNRLKDRLICCPHCHEEMTLAEYENHHARGMHDVSCIYCDDDGAAHDRCFDEFVDKNLLPDEIPTENLTETPIVIDPNDEIPDAPLCDCVTFRSEHYRHQLDHRVFDERYPELYQSYPIDFAELQDPGTLPVFSEESGLGVEASALVRMFLSNNWKFFHVYVRAYGYAKFLEVMPDTVVVSNFWCLCDCGMIPDKLHRHMIVATRDADEFQRAWDRVLVPEQRVVKAKSQIDTCIHLAYTILYVSRKKRNCESVVTSDDDTNATINAHFFMNLPLHGDAIVAICTLWSHGLGHWLKRKNCQKSVDAWNFEKYRDHWGNEKFRVRILEIMPRIKHCPVPLRWKPLGLEPDPLGLLLLHWFEDEYMRLSFTEDTSPDYRHFMMRQVELGNSLKKRMQGKWYVLNKMQVTQAHIVERLTKRKNAELGVKELEKQYLQEELNDVRAEMEQKIADVNRRKWEEKMRLLEEVAKLEQENAKLKQENADLMHQRVAYLERDNANLRLERKELWQELAEIRHENAQLKQRAQRDADLTALRQELASLKLENTELRQRNQINIHNVQGDVNNNNN